MTECAFIIGDVHGCLKQLEQLLTYWNPDSEKLFFIGDLIDRGENSRGVVQLAMKLRKEYGAVVIGGNHEEMFLEWLDAPINHATYYYPRGGKATISSFLGEERFHSLSHTDLSKALQHFFPEEITFLESLPDYVEHEGYLFVHAGIDPRRKDWRDTEKMFFRSIREPFYTKENKSGKMIIFGHTPTRRIHPNKKDDIWISPCKTKIDIDGGAVFGGMLHGLHLKENGEYQLHSITSNLEVRDQTFLL